MRFYGMSDRELARELKLRVQYQDWPFSVVERLCRIMGKRPSTVYSYFDGDIRPSLDFIHACVIATDGDPAVTCFLEPPGWRLVKLPEAEPDLKDPEAELTDVNLAAADAIRALRAALDPGGPGGARITRQEAETLRRCLDIIERELIQARQAVDREGQAGAGRGTPAQE